MNSLSIPISQVKITNQKIIESLLPEGICYVRTVGVHFEVLVAGVVCATVTVEDEQLHFQFGERDYPGFWGSKLKKLLVQKFPRSDSDRTVWQIFYRWEGAFSFPPDGHFGTKEEALASLKRYQVNLGAYLCSFKAKFIGHESFWTETAYRVDKNFFPGKNLGSVKITMATTTLAHLENINFKE